MSAIRDILVHPGYKGTQYVNHHLHSSKMAGERPPGTIAMEIPSIVSEDLWHRVQKRRRNNKHVQTWPSGSRLLQGLVVCGLCGYHFRSQSTLTRNAYACRGRLKYAHLDGSPRCTAPIVNAEWLEAEVWKRIEAILNDPNRLEPLIEETIETLQAREHELSARMQPINEQLTLVMEKKARLTDEYVMSNMDPVRFKQHQSSLQQEEDRLRSMRSEVDPAQIEELQNTQGLLRFWQGQLKAMNWNTEDDNGDRIRLADAPHSTVLKLVGFEEEEISEAIGFPATRRQLIDRLQLGVVVYEDRIEVKAIFPIEPIKHQLCVSTCRSGCLCTGSSTLFCATT